jgi:hypothetical protein
MAGIGVDIAEVINELGITAIILRAPLNLSEKINYDVNEQANNKFVREHLLTTSFAYDTVIISGDLLQFNSETYLVANKTPDSFEGGIVEYVGIIYKCNLPALSKILIPLETKNDDFTITLGWQVRKSPVYGIIHYNLRSVLLDSDASTGKETVYRLESFVPASYGVQPLDRLYISETEYYRVENVEKYLLPGIHVLSLVEDERALYTTASSSSSSPSSSPSSS